MVFNKRTQKTITGRLQKKRVDVKNIRLLMSYAIRFILILNLIIAGVVIIGIIVANKILDYY